MDMGYDARMPTTNFANRKVFLRCFNHASTKRHRMHRLMKKCAFIAMNLVPHLENLVSLVLKDSKGDLEMVMEEEEIREGRDRDTYDYDDDARVVKPVGWYSHRIMTNVNEGINIGGGLRQVTIALAVLVGPYYKEVDDAVEADLVKRAFGCEVQRMAHNEIVSPSSRLFDPLWTFVNEMPAALFTGLMRLRGTSVMRSKNFLLSGGTWKSYGQSENIEVPGLMNLRHIGQTTVGTTTIFGLFLGVGSLIHCGKSY